MIYPYSAIFIQPEKNNEISLHAATWMNPINIMLNERYQTQKAPYYFISFMWSSQKWQIPQDGKQGCQGLRELGKWEVTAHESKWERGFEVMKKCSGISNKNCVIL